MSDISNLSDTIVIKSDQLNSDDLVKGPKTITITGVKRGTDEQPVIINFEGDNGKPYKPCKSMRKVLIFAWGDDGREWIGRSMTIFNNPEVKFGGVKVGGIRISHMTDIERDIALSLNSTKGKKEPFIIKRLEKPKAIDVAPLKKSLSDAAKQGMAALQAAWKALTPEQRYAVSPSGTCPEPLKEAAKKADTPKPEPVIEPIIEPVPEPTPEPDGDFF